jgi:AraC-like DNA-binding protein
MPVRQVAHSVGYRQPAQFAKAFRRATGVSPSEYRIGAHRNGGLDELLVGSVDGALAA